MSIPFKCPNCGTAMQVSDHFSGQHGPCTACGKSIAIPTIAGAPGTGTSNGAIGVLAIVLGIGATALMLCVGVGGLFYALLIPAVGNAQSAAQRASSINNMRQITLALQSYHTEHGTFPPAVVNDANGTPLYSWRVLILPYLESSPLYDQFDKTKAWDDPVNLAISESMLPVFRSPSDGSVALNGTNYVCVTGKDTMFPGTASRSLGQVPDGMSNTILIVEVRDLPGSWAAPIDPQMEDLIDPLVGDEPAQLHPAQPRGGILVGFADGTVRSYDRAATARVVQPTGFTVNDGQYNPIE